MEEDVFSKKLLEKARKEAQVMLKEGRSEGEIVAGKKGKLRITENAEKDAMTSFEIEGRRFFIVLPKRDLVA